MNTIEIIGALIASLFVALLGIQFMAASYRAGINEGRRREASRQLADVIREANSHE